VKLDPPTPYPKKEFSMRSSKVKQIGIFALLMSAMAMYIAGCDDEKDIFTDSRDGKKYKTVVIGTQTWIAENLNIDLPGSKCYINEPKNCDKYGRLYDWETAMKACPSGWHLPSNDEWQTLVDLAGGEEIAGKKLKAKKGWNEDGNGTNDFRFAALPGGSGIDGGFHGGTSDWWSSSKFVASHAYYWRIHSYKMDIENSIGDKTTLNSVRCVQGIAPEQVKEQEKPKATSANSPDSKNYKTVDMPDGKTWLAENLNYNTDGSKCYVDETQNCDKYGRLYNWETAKKICPKGWHLPSDAEWDKLINAVGGKEAAGKHLKAKSGWGNYEGQVGNGKDTYGFSALPGGANCPSFGSIFDIGIEGIWWSATEKNTSNAYYISISYNRNYSGMYKYDDDKECWLSVRCVKN